MGIDHPSDDLKRKHQARGDSIDCSVDVASDDQTGEFGMLTAMIASSVRGATEQLKESGPIGELSDLLDQHPIRATREKGAMKVAVSHDELVDG